MKRKLKQFLTMDACKPFVEDLQNNIRNLTAYRDNIKLLQ